ncbi:MAG: hypothetical protein HY817_01475 [Candidatus Abawacabacteria bacterium]|nr:hypothetical protein [Candidatus Abawacabacteria bacterium]
MAVFVSGRDKKFCKELQDRMNKFHNTPGAQEELGFYLDQCYQRGRNAKRKCYITPVGEEYDSAVELIADYLDDWHKKHE